METKPEAGSGTTSQNKENNCVPKVNLHAATDNQSILFQIVPINVYGPKGNEKIYAFVDDGADVTMLDWAVAQRIGLRGTDSELKLQWLNGNQISRTTRNVDCEVSGSSAEVKRYKLKGKTMGKFPHVASLPFLEYNKAKPKMILSLCHAFLTVPIEAPVSPPFCGNVAVNTRLGWILYGPAMEEDKSVRRSCHAKAVAQHSKDASMNSMMRNFFEIESLAVKLDSTPLVAEETKRAMEIMESTLRFVDGRYQCGLLWRAGFVEFPASYQMALKRFEALEKRMSQRKEFGMQYRRAAEDFVKKGYARQLSPEEAAHTTPKTFFLPHFGVTNPNKRNVRLVFDGAAKCDGVSLNDALLAGPDLNQQLLAVLAKFRTERIAVCGDLKEMFMQVAVRREDREALRFLWRSDPHEQVGQYAMTRMIFGAACSPTVAQYVKNFHARKYMGTNDRAAKAIIERHYVDDYVDCFSSEEEALEVVQQVKDIHRDAGFELCKIVSNVASINNQFGENGAAGVDVTTEGSERVLGMLWLPHSDEFGFNLNFQRVPREVISNERRPTKRELLSVAMSIFDPFGFISPLVVSAKIMMQQLWKSGAEWDDPIGDGLHAEWGRLLRKLKKVKDFRIPRCYSSNFYCARKSLHIFSDASEQAMATVAYWRITYQDKVSLAFVMGKTNCALARVMSIPRLELQAAVYAVRLKSAIERFHGFAAERVYYWSDSQTVIRWIHSDSRLYKQFVGNRVAKILEVSEESQWRWVPGVLNPADDATRITNELELNGRWKKGPQFLLQGEEEWPVFIGTPENESGKEELKGKCGFVLIANDVRKLEFNVNRYSNYDRLRRAIGWSLRFVFNIAARIKNNTKRANSLTADELEEAETMMWRLAQMEEFKEEYEALKKGKSVKHQSELRTLNPFLDEVGLIRCSGRIDNAPYLKWETKRPIILPKRLRLTRLLVEWYHKKSQHVNQTTVIAEIRLRFWIPSIRVLVNSVFQQCLECKRRRSKPLQPVMGLLPSDRLTPYVRPFSYTGVDYFGPVEVSIRRRREKRWAALFTCLSTRAVHLEVAADLSSDASLVCIRNFVNRRGVPVQIRSDNGTNFVGINKELGKGTDFLDQETVADGLAPLGIKWKFNTPANPSAGGAWERLVGSVKRALAIVLKEHAPRLKTLISLLIECENIVNSRPLTHLPVTPSEPEPLTPNHFLIGCPNSTQTPAPFERRLCSLRKQWRILQNMKNLFWTRWLKEYMPELTRRVKWCRPAKPLTLGSLVLVCDGEFPRSRWRRGKVVKLFIGPDGVAQTAQTAEVQTAGGLLRRAVSGLAPLDISEESDGECPESIHGAGDVGDRGGNAD